MLTIIFKGKRIRIRDRFLDVQTKTGWHVHRTFKDHETAITTVTGWVFNDGH